MNQHILRALLNLIELIQSRDVSAAGAIDTLDQAVLCETYRSAFEQLFPRQLVLAIDGQFYVGGALDEVSRRASREHPGKYYYAMQL